MKLLILLLVLSGCVSEGEKVKIQSEDLQYDYEVRLLFIKDNCKVYRFTDQRYHYFTDCGETMTTVYCGKNCLRQENIK